MSDNNKPQRDAEEAAKLQTSIKDFFEHRIVFNEFLGFTLDEHDGEKVCVNFPMRPELVGHFLYGRLHGGVISSAMDVAGGLAVMWSIAAFHSHESADEILERFRYLGTVDLRVDFLRPGIGKQFMAEAETTRLGRRIAAVSMRLKNEQDILIATGNATYIVS